MTTTAIESKLKREGGTVLPFGAITYHFVPYTDGAHVCDIENPEHIDRLLSIPEGYGLYRGNGKPVAPRTAPAKRATPAPAAASAILLGGDFPASFTIHGTTYDLGTIVARAHQDSTLSTDDWNALPQDERDEAINSTLDAIDAAGSAQPADEQHTERAYLVTQFIELFGKKPHYNMSVNKLREMIAAQTEAKNAGATE